MNIGLKSGIYSALGFIVVILSLFIFKVNHKEAFMLLLIGSGTLAIFVGVAVSILVNFNRNRTGGLSLLSDIKVGLTSSAVFSILAAIFLVVYFTSIDPEFKERRKEEWLARMQEPEALKLLEEKMKENPDMYKGKSLEDIQERNIDNTLHMLGASTIFPISLFSFLLMGMVYTFLVTAFNRLILAKLG
ncbi:MAG: DUF4199 domain-containing protein [Flavobacteriales bacterium]|nr:DUF4199 domain-containing protein [Flavobacteriales bacterium]